MGLASGFALESTEVEAIAAAGIQNNVVRSRVDDFYDRQTLKFRKPSVV